MNHELSRPYDPWERFTHRDEDKHHIDDTSRLFPSHATSYDIIDGCFSHEGRRLDSQIPRRDQILRDFLGEVLEGPTRSSQPYGIDIDRRNNYAHIVLVDDRRNHPNCEKKIRRACTVCKKDIFSRNLSVPQLRDRLALEVCRLTLCKNPLWKHHTE